MEMLLIIGFLVLLIARGKNAEKPSAPGKHKPGSSRQRRGGDDFAGFGVGALFLFEEIVDQSRKMESRSGKMEDQLDLIEFEDTDWCDEDFFDDT